MGKGGGGSEPEKPKMSIGEKTQHATAAAEWDHYKSTYRPLERQYLSDAQKNLEDRGQAQASTSVMREGTDAMRMAALGGGVSGAASAVGNASTAARTKAASVAEQERDSRVTGALGVGRELATDSTRSLGSLATTGARGAINDMNNKLTVDTARSKARAEMLGSIAGAGTAMYMGGAGSKKPALSGIRGSSRSDYEALMGGSGSRQKDYREMMR